MRRALIAAARDAWRAAQERVAELQESLDARERELERARYDWEQWDLREQFEHTVMLLEEAQAAEQTARRELVDVLESEGVLPGGDTCVRTRART